jgi:hypothetical protein
VAYATEAELVAWLGHPVEGAGRMLDRATRRIRAALISAVYDPADPVVVAALRTACLEQCAAWDTAGTDGSEAGTDADPAAWGSVAAGSISLSRASGGGQAGAGGQSSAARAAAAAGLAEQAWLALQQAGLTGHGPRTGPPWGWC